MFKDARARVISYVSDAVLLTKNAYQEVAGSVSSINEVDNYKRDTVDGEMIFWYLLQCVFRLDMSHHSHSQHKTRFVLLSRRFKEVKLGVR